jgi:UDP-N-acetylglucosamine 3-dehydrogenase
MLKVGILGAGMIASVHAAGYKNLKDKAQVVAVADVVPEKAEKLAKDFGAKVYKDGMTLIKEADVDVIDICLPTFLHAEHAVAACEQGRHVLCEKPMALTLEEADAMIAAAEKANVKLMIAQCVRFWPEYALMYELIQEGSLGRPLFATGCRFSQTPSYSWNHWLLDPKLSGSAALDLHIHDVDYLTWLFGDPQQVSAVGVVDERGGVAMVDTSVTYKNGGRVSVGGGWLMPTDYPFTTEMTIYCEKGCLEFSSRAGVNIEARDKVARGIKVYRPGQPVEVIPVEGKDAYQTEIGYFLDCVAQDRPVDKMPPQEARRSLSVGLAAIESAKTGKPVQM